MKLLAAAALSALALAGTASADVFQVVPTVSAPAELGPMLRPKFDSTLLIAASTCHGTP